MNNRMLSLDKHRHVAAKGNQYWKLRKKHGKGKIIENPQVLIDLACGYFEWCTENPLYRVECFQYRGKVTKVKVPCHRPLSLRGLCLHIGISYQTFLNYSAKESYRDYFEVCEYIRNVCFVQNFCLAAAGLANPCIVARQLSSRTEKLGFSSI